MWVRDIELGEQQKIRLEQRRRQVGMENRGSKSNAENYRTLREQHQQIGREKAREGSQLHLIGCMLYWGEGAKKRNALYFANADPNMLVIFQRFLREELQVTIEEMRIQIHCHATEKERVHEIKKYWLNLLRLPSAALHKTQIKVSSEQRHNHLTNGVCALRVHSTRLVMHIFGAIQEYGSFNNPDWLF